jgi:hypothetical protein
MSNSIIYWAKMQVAGGPSAKAVLLCLADEASTHGECWTGQETISRESEQSVDSVQRRLRDLERRGLIYCVSKRHWSNSGKWRSNMIVVLADAICVSFAMKHGYDPERAREGSGENGRNSCGDERIPQNQDDSVSTVPQSAVRAGGAASDYNELRDGEMGCHTADCGTVENAELRPRDAAVCGTDRTALLRYENPNFRTITPQKPPEPSPAAALEDDSWLSSWNKFVEAWFWKPDELLEPVRRKFRNLDPDDRNAAVEWIPAYLDEVRRKQGKPMAARRWIGFRGWEPFALKAKKNPTLTPGRDVFVFKGTPPWAAWAQAGGKMYAIHSADNGGQLGRYFPTLYPPGAARGDASQDGRAVDGLANNSGQNGVAG